MQQVTRKPTDLYLAREDTGLISAILHDDFRPRASEAHMLLRRAAALVRPLMVKYHWHIDALCEFFEGVSGRNSFHRVQNRPRLLRTGAFQHISICVKVRRDSNGIHFRDIEEIVDDVLKELCLTSSNHSSTSSLAMLPHSRAEYWDLRRRGHTGIVLQGVRLGNSHTYVIDPATLQGQQSLQLPPSQVPRHASIERIRRAVHESAPLCVQRKRRQLRELEFR